MSDMYEDQPDRGSRTEPLANPPMPPTGGEAMQDPAPPEGGSSEEILQPQGESAPPADESGSSRSTPGDTPEKDPEDWATGDEPMTGPQRSYLETLARQAGEQVPDDLTKAQASELIDRLQARTGRGQ